MGPVEKLAASRIGGGPALTDEQLRCYEERGYLHIKGAFPQEPIHAFMGFVAHAIELELRQHGYPISRREETLHSSLIKLKQEKPWSSSWIYQTILTSWALHGFFHEIPLEPYVMELLALEDPLDLGIVSPAFRFDIPGDTRNVRTWHQDSSYFLETEKGDDALVVWIPLNEAYRENGSVLMAPGSHKEGRLSRAHERSEGFRSEQYTTPSELVESFPHEVVEARPGDLLFIHMDLIHSSGTNISNEVRYTAQIRFSNISVPEYRPVFLSREYPEYKR